MKEFSLLCCVPIILLYRQYSTVTGFEEKKEMCTQAFANAKTFSRKQSHEQVVASASGEGTGVKRGRRCHLTLDTLGAFGRRHRSHGLPTQTDSKPRSHVGPALKLGKSFCWSPSWGNDDTKGLPLGAPAMPEN